MKTDAYDTYELCMGIYGKIQNIGSLLTCLMCLANLKKQQLVSNQLISQLRNHQWHFTPFGRKLALALYSKQKKTTPFICVPSVL